MALHSKTGEDNRRRHFKIKCKQQFTEYKQKGRGQSLATKTRRETKRSMHGVYNQVSKHLSLPWAEK